MQFFALITAINAITALIAVNCSSILIALIIALITAIND